MNVTVKHLNGHKLSLEGMFDLSAAAAVNSITNKDGTTKTVYGEQMSVAKNGTGTYDVTVKMASSLDGNPVFQPVEVLYAAANLYGATVATALGARVSAVAKDSNGNIKITVKTTDNTGAAADTTGAISVCFKAEIATARMGGVL